MIFNTIYRIKFHSPLLSFWQLFCAKERQAADKSYPQQTCNFFFASSLKLESIPLYCGYLLANYHKNYARKI